MLILENGVERFSFAMVQDRIVDAMRICWQEPDREGGWLRLRAYWPDVSADAGDYDARGRGGWVKVWHTTTLHTSNDVMWRFFLRAEFFLGALRGNWRHEALATCQWRSIGFIGSSGTSKAPRDVFCRPEAGHAVIAISAKMAAIVFQRGRHENRLARRLRGATWAP